MTLKTRSAFRYIFWDIIPGFFLGLIAFILILLMFQVLRLMEFALIHGIDSSVILEIFTYLTVSFLPIVLPMSLLLATLLAYNRLSNDSEVIAFKSLGLHLGHIASPAIFLSLLVFLLSVYTTFYMAPWGNRQFEVLINKISATKASTTIREGVFSDGFFDLTVYVNKINSQTNKLENIFIYDDRHKTPLTVIAQSGQILKDEKSHEKVLLRLEDGDIYKQNENHTKIHFKSYDIFLEKKRSLTYKRKTPPSLNYNDLRKVLNSPNAPPEQMKIFKTEWHKRWALAVACIIFSLVGIGLGVRTNQRSGSSGGMTLSIGVIVSYWIFYLIFESLGQNGWLPIAFALWVPNMIFGLFAFRWLRSGV